MSDEQVVFRSPALDEAVKAYSGFAANSRMRGKNSLDQMGTVSFGGSAVDEYNGMHKLVLITDNSNPESLSYKVCVCDGATYNPQTHTSGSSRVEVNGVSFDLDAEVFELSDKTAYIYVKFTAGTQNSEAQVAYQSGDRLPASSDTETSYLIGRTVCSNGAFTIQQDHIGTATNGVIRIPWGTICNA